MAAMLRQARRAVNKAIQWTFLLTLPITILPFLHASLSGWMFAFWDYRLMNENTDKFLYEMKSISQDWGVGGDVPTFRQFQDTHNDFGVLRINSNDFARKLGFTLPDQYMMNPDSMDAPIDKYANIETLVRDTTNKKNSQKPKEQWVFLVHHGFAIFDWDNAFRNAVRFAQGDPKLNQTGIYYAQCSGTASFLCGIWDTRPPALIHFKVEDDPLTEDDVEDGLTYSTDLKHLRPVTVRIIEFPLKDVYTGLSVAIFPGHPEQVLAMMTGDHLYEQFEPYNYFGQKLLRFSEYMDKFLDAKGTIPYYINSVDDWVFAHITTPLGIEKAVRYLHAYVFDAVGNAVQIFVMIPYTLVNELVKAFLGTPLRGDYIMGDMEAHDGPHNILDDLFGGALQQVLMGAQDFASSSAAKDAMTISTSRPPP